MNDGPTASAPPEAVDHNRMLFDIAAAVAYLHTLGAGAATPNFVRGLINSGQIPHVRIGKKFYATRASLDNWINSRERRRRG